jgi:hypothetical protein
MKIILIVLLTVLTGCSTTAAQMQAAANIQAQRKPTLHVTCAQGCPGLDVEYNDPNAQTIQMPKNGWDAAMHVTDTLGAVMQSSIVPLAMGSMAISGFQALKGATQSTVNTTTTTTDSHNVSNQIGPDSQNVTSPTTTTTDSHSVTDNHSATATPTVVTQPTPLVVNTPAPTTTVITPDTGFTVTK